MLFSSTAINQELAHLVADASVTRTLAPRRGEGGVGEQGGGDMLAQANETGTYDDSTVSGEAIIVMLDKNGEEGVPTVINGGCMSSVEVIDMFSSHSSSTKKFKCFVVPGAANGFNTCCFQLISQGASGPSLDTFGLEPEVLNCYRCGR
jgi:hypothetical protein